MIRSLLTKIIKKKNPAFKLDESIPIGLLIHLVFQKAIAYFRSFRLLLFGHWPTKIFLGKGVSFFYGRNIRWGQWIQLEDGVHLNALGRHPIILKNNIRIGAYSRLITSTTFSEPGAFICIGNNVGIGEFAYLGGAGGLTIGDDCIIGQYFSCHPENHRFSDLNELIRLQGHTREGIHIGANCWIGSKVTILDGVNIGSDSVIAAGAVVTKDMPSHSVIAGVPARVIRSIKPMAVEEGSGEGADITPMYHKIKQTVKQAN